MSVSVSRGALTTGAIGAFLFAACSIVLGLLTMMVRSPSAMEGFLYLYSGLGLIAAILMSVGVFASAKVYGGAQIAAGVFAIIAGLGAAGTLLLPMLIEFNSMRDAVIVAIGSSTGSALLFACFAGIANHRPARTERSYGAITASGWIYGATVIVIGIGLKFGLRENAEMFATFSLVAALAMCGALITHGVGLLQLRSAGREPRAELGAGEAAVTA